MSEWVIISDQQRKKLLEMERDLRDFLEGNGMWAVGAGLDPEERARVAMTVEIIHLMAAFPKGRLRF
jgi:hypothetical protein